MKLRVECDATFEGERAPKVFWIGSREVEVHEQLDRWPSHDCSYYKVRGSDDAIYILRHDHEQSQWELAVYEVGHPPLALPPRRSAASRRSHS